MVSGDSIHIDPKDLEVVFQLRAKETKTVGEVRTLLGFLSYYRSFIQDFSRLAKPLFEMLQSAGEASVKSKARQRKGRKTKKRRQRTGAIQNSNQVDV